MWLEQPSLVPNMGTQVTYITKMMPGKPVRAQIECEDGIVCVEYDGKEITVTPEPSVSRVKAREMLSWLSHLADNASL